MVCSGRAAVDLIVRNLSLEFISVLFQSLHGSKILFIGGLPVFSSFCVIEVLAVKRAGAEKVCLALDAVCKGLCNPELFRCIVDSPWKFVDGQRSIALVCHILRKSHHIASLHG